MDDKLTKFVIKYSIISSIAVFVIGGHLKDFSANLIDLIIEPLFSIDLNNEILQSHRNLKGFQYYKLFLLFLQTQHNFCLFPSISMMM